MSIDRWRRVAALLPLLALLATVLPYQPPAVQALTTSTVLRSTPTAAEDQDLVRASFQHPIQDSQFYFVLPDRFENTDRNNDRGGYGTGDSDADVLRHGFRPSNKAYYHGGDLKGVLSRLDYLQGLGINAIWMTPIFKNRPVQCGATTTIADCSAGYHGYWITDFTQIDPHLGTNAEMTALVRAAHARGMKVFFDIITNHTADVITYEEQQYNYRNKRNFPYQDADGNEFDDRQYAGTDTFPPLDPEISFPYTPVFRTPEDATVKKPDWLNNPIYYHNRGNSTFSGESSEYGDFFGLDDLFTEHPTVVNGMIDIYRTWVSDFGIDGYRIDTVKHVNIEFWQEFAPGILQYAKAHGRPDFFMYGEVFSGDVPFVSHYTTEGRLQAALDFPFQGTARGFASQSQPTNNLRDLFAADDYYTDADSNAYQLPTFLSNHDIGRFGRFLQQDNAGASDAELLRRDRLGHALMYFARGMPIVYYGDEQGFTGDGGDQDARQDMMPSQVPSYNDDDLIGTNATTAADNFDRNHPLYQTLNQLAGVRQAHEALRRGAQIHRYSSDTAGIYAFSRIERDQLIEYIVAANNAETQQSATFKTFSPNERFSAVYPAGGGSLTTDANANITVTVPPLDVVVYRADRSPRTMRSAPNITITAPTQGSEVTGRVEVAAQLDSDRFAEVTFAVKVGDAAEYTYIGTDNNAPYRVFYDVSDLAPGTALSFKAIVNDPTDDNEYGYGDLNSATVTAMVRQDDTGNCPAPAYAVIHYNRPNGDYEGWGLHLWGDAIDPSEATEWTAPKQPNGEDAYGVFWFIKLADGSQPLNFIVHKGDEKDTPNDRSFIPEESPEVWLKQGDAQIHTSAVAARGAVRIHYQRADNNYEGWGLHLWGDAIDPSEATEWTAPKPFDGTDSFGRYADVKLADVLEPVNFIVHKGDEKDTPNDRMFMPLDARTGDIWLVQGDDAAYTSRAAAENVAIIHYHRIDGDYDGWGLHVWAGAATPTDWTSPIMPAGRDRFGVYFRVPLAPDATALSYIIHKGDQKDLPEDQELDLATYGHEVWVIQSTPGYLLPIVRDCGNTDMRRQMFFPMMFT
jgi:glycosidase